MSTTNETNEAVRSAILADPPVATPAPVQDFEDAADAYKRILAEAMALGEDNLTTLNVDVVGATSTILGVYDRILAYRERIAELPGFNIDHVDKLADYAKACWYAAITSLPEPGPKDYQAMLEEATTLRTHLLTWAEPLVHAQKFEPAAIDAIRAGSGNKDLASDVVALVSLYRAKWSEVQSVCGVTEADLNRGAVLGPALFAAVSRRENKTLPSFTDGSLKVRRFWTLADRAYDQCQRAVSYFEWGVSDAGKIVPSLRGSSGTRSSSSTVTRDPAPAAPAVPAAPAQPPAAAAPVVTAGPQIGGAGGPFGK